MQSKLSHSKLNILIPCQNFTDLIFSFCGSWMVLLPLCFKEISFLYLLFRFFLDFLCICIRNVVSLNVFV